MKNHMKYTILIMLLMLPVVSAIECSEVTDVYFFYSKTCPHCTNQKPLMKYIDEQNENVIVHFLEVSEEPEKWDDFRQRYSITSPAVPRTFIGNRSFIGYTESDGPLEYNEVYAGYTGYRNQIIAATEDIAGDINVPGERQERKPSYMIFLISILYALSFFFIKDWGRNAKRLWAGGLIASILVSIFIFMTMMSEVAIKDFAMQLPFPAFVAIVAIADGFNPCAFTVLIILLSLLTYTKSRRDMAIIGATFIGTSAIMYFIFIMTMVLVGSAFIEQYDNTVYLVLGVAITIAGAINVKDFFYFKKGVSLSISEKHQSKITKRASSIVKNLKEASTNKKLFLAALGGTIILAIFVNVVELGCTAILPTVYMASLVARCPAGMYACQAGWTALYGLIYIIPLLAILISFIYSFKSTRITEKQGRVLKLVSGLFMLVFGLIMLFEPQLLTIG